MRRIRSERGAGLLLVIGIVAALTTLAASLVILVINAQSNTRTDRMRAKSFNVAEAALDRAMYDLSVPNAWPTAAAPVFGTTAFRSSFTTADFPNPTKGQFVQVVYYDNWDTNGDGKISPVRNGAGDKGWDANKDGLLYVEVQSGVGNATTRLQAQLQRIDLEPLARKNVAINTPGRLTINNQKPDVATTGDPATAEIGGGIWDSSHQLPESEWSDALDANISGLTGDVPNADSIMPPDVLQLLKDSATHTFTSPVGPSTPNASLEGITYIKSGSVSDLPNGVTNGAGTSALPKMPGILILEGGGGLNVGGNGDFYGLIYTDGPFTNSGNYVIHGMLIAKGDVTLKGDQTVMYDPAVLYSLSQVMTLHVRLVGGTWREIQPVY